MVNPIPPVPPHPAPNPIPGQSEFTLTTKPWIHGSRAFAKNPEGTPSGPGAPPTPPPPPPKPTPRP